ncbi:MAG: hypothetical protein RRA94_15805 [Bacteroidota bacterium]|nr:hypothetical protein [Bacteroidota bacterium]
MRQHGATTSCPSCGEENSILDLRCRDCGAFIRDRVPAMNLFSALWGMIERPAATLLRFARSEQKNYVHVLFALTGPLLIAVLLAALRAGDRGMAFGYALAAIAVLGPFAGLLFLAIVAWISNRALRLFLGVQLGYRLVAGYIAYAAAPLMWASVIVLPLQLGLFGLTLFSDNPAAWSIRPVPFWLLAALDGIAVLWTFFLLPLGLRAHGVRYARALLFPLLSTLSLLAVLAAAGRAALPLFP